MKIITPSSSEYPELLKHISDPPSQFWCEGDLQVTSLSCVAVVGARECTPYGEKAAFDLSKSLAQAGVVVVSGLALGIDTAAHKGALAGGGKTIAVLGCGMDIPYPSENISLKKNIFQNGVVISEYAPGTQATVWSFPRRNRIISGLSLGVVVVEAGLKSGSLITANLALQQGRDVFAVPGNISSPLSAGTHRLIQSGAKLVNSVEDILEELKLGVKTSFKEIKENISHAEKKLLHLLSNGPRHMDELLEATGSPMNELSSLLIEMELNGKIRSLPGSCFEKNNEVINS